MKKLTLNQTWTLCLRMWKWIDEQIGKGDRTDIDMLKYQWLKKNNYELGKIEEDCFFCERNINLNDGGGYPNCKDCPGVLVNKRFACMNKTYHYTTKPRKFYQKLLQFNKKRKTK